MIFLVAPMVSDIINIQHWLISWHWTAKTTRGELRSWAKNELKEHQHEHNRQRQDEREAKDRETEARLWGKETEASVAKERLLIEIKERETTLTEFEAKCGSDTNRFKQQINQRSNLLFYLTSTSPAGLSVGLHPSPHNHAAGREMRLSELVQ